MISREIDLWVGFIPFIPYKFSRSKEDDKYHIKSYFDIEIIDIIIFDFIDDLLK
jgi:hypothetical protein